MKKIIALTVFMFAALSASAGVTGLWQTIDDETGKPKSIAAVYEYEGKVYGRLIMTYEPDGATMRDNIQLKKYKADKVIGKPAFCGLDFIWDMSPAKDGKYKSGKILNPPNGKIYNSEMWVADNGDLIVRGKIGPFGKNQTWKPFAKTSLPESLQSIDITTFTPVIPKVK